MNEALRTEDEVVNWWHNWLIEPEIDNSLSFQDMLGGPWSD